MFDLPPVPQGFARRWTRCKTCGNVAYLDYQPYSLANPILTLPCGHGAAVRFYEAVDTIDEAMALKALDAQQFDKEMVHDG